jgi:hypothetical protein
MTLPDPEPTIRCADCGQPIAACTCEADPVPPEPVPYPRLHDRQPG